MQHQFPHTADELLDLLEEAFPEPDPRPGDDLTKIMHKAGERSVVLFLRRLKEGRVPIDLRQKRGEGRLVPRKNT